MLAALDRAEPMHVASRDALEADPGPYVLSPFVLCELDYLLTTGVSLETELALLGEVAVGTYELAHFEAGDVEAAFRVIETYRDLRVGLADASIVVLAGKLGTNRVLTLDERHFRVLTTPSQQTFVVLPADA